MRKIHRYSAGALQFTFTVCGGGARKLSSNNTSSTGCDTTVVPFTSVKFAESLQDLGTSRESKLVTVGSAAADRFFHNESFEASPWQASCIELRVVETEEVLVQRNPVMSRPEFFKPAPVKRRITTLSPSQETSTKEDEALENTTPLQVEVVFYYETSRPEGLHAYRQIATLVLRDLLPGKVENNSCIGFATWSVPRKEYYDLLTKKPQLSV